MAPETAMEGQRKMSAARFPVFSSEEDWIRSADRHTR